MAKIKTRWQKRHVDNCGFYENDKFCETGEFGKDWDNETTKQAYWQLAIYTILANLRKWGIGQESINGLAKPQMRWQRGEYWQKANFDKYGECAKKKSSRVWIFSTMTNFEDMANLARTYQRFDKDLQRDDKKGHLDKWRL